MKYSLENIETARLKFIKLTDDYFDDWIKFYNDFEGAKYVGAEQNKTPEENCKWWFERCKYREQNNLGIMNALIEKQTSSFIGNCGLIVQTVDDIRELEIGYSLLPKFRGKGYAIEAAKKCRNHAFENDLCDSLISIIHPQNIASQKVALNNGMKLEKQTTFKGQPVNIYRIDKHNGIKT